MPYYHRLIEKELTKMLGNFPAVMILGPRQVGKSTLLEYLSRSHHLDADYVTLDNPVLAGLARQQPEQFLTTYNRPLIVDEFQYAPNLTSYIKIEIDQHQSAALFDKQSVGGTLFFLTGSQVFDTMDTIRESLAGRVGIIHLYGLSTREIEQIPASAFSPIFTDIKQRRPTHHLGEKDFYKRLLRGSYPALQTQPQLDTQQYFSSYLQTYIERDIRQQLRPENEYNFTRFISLLAARTGQPLIIENIAATLGIDGKTAQSWLSLVKATGLVFILPPYFNNNTKRLTKKPKLYFTDTGLACYLAGYPTLDGLIRSSYKGQIFETYVITELLKSFTNANIDITKNLYYYRRGDKQESDLLLRLQNTFYPIEIKAADHASSRDTVWFDDLRQLGLDIGNGLVICRASSLMALGDNNYTIPVEYI